MMSDPLLSEARKFAEWALMERLPAAQRANGYGAGKKLGALKGRIARIRAGNGDDLPEVQAVLLALKARSPQ